MDWSDKKVLITGGTSFLANAIVPRLLDYGCNYIRLTSRDEVKQSKMKETFGNDDRLNFILSDVRDEKSTDYSMKDIDVVIHTAALKRVDAAEYNVFEVIKTNTMGAVNIVNCAIKNNVEKVIGISTDKAVAPITIYGSSKFAAEKIFTHGNVYSGRDSTQFACVRYGNVFGSTGSVAHIFRQQFLYRRPPTITHPEMTRFFMTVDESVELIEYALNNMKGNGEVFVRKAPSFKITDLAQAYFGDDYHPKFIGLRGIEKIHETLVCKEEMLETIENNKYYTILPIKPIHLHRWTYPHNDWNLCEDYTSENNTDWLSQYDLEEKIEGIHVS